jgi:hypothetical protein
VDDDVTSAGDRRRVGAVRVADVVVVDHLVALVLVENLDAELVRATVALLGSVDGGQDEAVAAPVDRAVALVLGLVAVRDDQPVVRPAVEVQVAGLELELCVAGRDRLAVLVPRGSL